MLPFFKDLFQYNFDTNDQLLQTIAAQKDLVSEKAIQWANHIVNAHQIWNARIVGLPLVLDTWDLRPLSELIEQNQLNYQQSERIISEKNLAELINYSTTKGIPYSNRLKDILFHIINHSTHHRAQVMSDFKQSGIEPFVTDYIFYKR